MTGGGWPILARKKSEPGDRTSLLATDPRTRASALWSAGRWCRWCRRHGRGRRREAEVNGRNGLRLLGRTLSAGRHGIGARLRDLGQHCLLEAHVALDGVHEVRDQVPASLQLDLDLGQRLVDAQPLLNQAVVDQDAADDENDKN